jgi:hypothetical protein
MGPRAAIILAAVVAFALAGCDGASYNGGGGSDMAAPAVHDLGTFACRVNVTATDPTTGAPTMNAPAILVATAEVGGESGPHWTLAHTGDADITPPTTDTNGFDAQYQVQDPGTWTFSVRFDTGCSATGAITLGNPSGAQVLYRFRALPPDSSGFPLTDLTVVVTGGESRNVNITLDSGTPVAGTLRAGGVGVPGEVRLIADLGPDAIAFAGSNGSFTLAVNATGNYTPLFIPTSTTLAPHLGTSAMGATFVGASFDIPGGVAVSGSVVDGSAAAIGGANVVLRAGALPSGPGTTSAAGAFTLYAEPGAYTMSFGAADWPQGSLDGVSVPAGGTSVAVAYTIARVAVGGSVVGDDGTTPVAGARVTITSHAPLANVANVSIGGGAAQPAGGRVARVVTTDVNGALPAMQLPLGSYDLIVEPPGPSLDGLTAVPETLTGAATWTIALAKPVPLAVTVTRGDDGSPVAGVALTAMETVGLGAAPTGTTGANGQFTFAIDKGASLDLVVEPPAASKLAGARVALPAGGGSTHVTLGPGLAFTGSVNTPDNKSLPGVRVEALCFSCGSTTPIATSISDANGAYHLYLPDPGEIAVDGGAGD